MIEFSEKKIVNFIGCVETQPTDKKNNTLPIPIRRGGKGEGGWGVAWEEINKGANNKGNDLLVS